MFRYVTVSSFPGVPDGTYPLGILNKVYGRNGSGKSSLFRAILWCVTGLLPDGSDAGNLYGDCTVEVGIHPKDVLWRQRKNKRQGIAFNGNPVLDWQAQHLTGRAFACMFFPMTFFFLSEAQQREVFLSITPHIDVETLLAERVAGYVKGTLPQGCDIKKTYEQYVAMRRALDKDVARLEGSLAATIASLDSAPKCNSDSDLGDLVAKQEQLKIVEEKLLNARISHRRWDEYAAAQIVYNQALSAHKARVNKMSMQGAENSEPLKSREEMIATMELRKTEYDSALRKANEIRTTGETLRERLARLDATPDTCSQCGQKLAPEALAHVTIERESLQKRRKELLAEFQAADGLRKAAESLFIVFQKEYAAWEKLVAKTPQEPHVPPLPEEPSAIKPDLMQFQKNRDEVMKEVAALQALQAEKERGAGEAKRLLDAKVKLTSELETARKQLAHYSAMEDALHPIKGVESEMLRRKLGQIKIEGFEFSFFETLLNGTVKEKFSVRRCDGVTLSQLSTGEKVKFGLALSELIANVSGTPLRSVFVETADVVDRFKAIPGFQLSVERVDKETPTLTVQIVKPFVEAQ